MKVGIYSGEAFPVYEVRSDGFTEIEVDAETLARWRHTFNEFEDMQKAIVRCMKEQGKGDDVYEDTWCGFHVDLKGE